MYLYMHVSPSGRKYIGITQQKPQERWRNGKGYPRNKHFQNAIKKYGWENFEHIILFDDLTEDEANEYEEELIDLFDTTNPQKGYNLHTGGRHHKVSQESRDKLSKALKGKYAGKNNPFYGKHHTAETMEKIYKPVEKYSLNGEYICTYKSLKDAAIDNGVHPTDISKVCRQVKKKTCAGYQWKFKGDKRVIKPYRHKAHNRRSVIQIDEKGAVIQIFESLYDAGIRFGTNGDKCIGDCCRGKQKTAYGYRWQYG